MDANREAWPQKVVITVINIIDSDRLLWPRVLLQAAWIRARTHPGQNCNAPAPTNGTPHPNVHSNFVMPRLFRHTSQRAFPSIGAPAHVVFTPPSPTCRPAVFVLPLAPRVRAVCRPARSPPCVVVPAPGTRRNSQPRWSHPAAAPCPNALANPAPSAAVRAHWTARPRACARGPCPVACLKLCVVFGFLPL